MLQSGFIPFLCAPTHAQLENVKEWTQSISCCAVVTTKGVSYVADSEREERLVCFMDGFNYSLYKRFMT